MSAEERLNAPDEFKIGLIVSLVAHLVLVMFFIVRAIVFTGDAFESLPAIRVDIVGLPDKYQPTDAPPPAKPDESEAKAPTKKETAPPEPLPTKKTPDAINLDRSKNKQQDALERLKKMQALDKIRDDLKKESAEEERRRLEAAAAAARAKAGAAKIKGNQLAPGTDLTGIDKLQHEDYRNALDRHIKPYWQLPEWMARKQFKALVLIRLDQQGRLISKQLMKTSGNPDFDASVLDTVDRAVPFPVPPEKFIAKAAVEGVLLEFGSDNQ